MSRPIEKQIELEIANRFWRAVIRKVEEGSGDRRGIHVTDLVYDCLRRAYYDKRLGELISAVSDSEGLMVVWIGQMLHEMPIDPARCEHEKQIEVELDGVKVEGRIDEVCRFGETHVVIDKKSTRTIPSSPYDHHVKQVLFYSAILIKRYGYRVSHAGILYLDVANLKTRLFIFPVSMQMVDVAMKEMEKKAKTLHHSLSRNIPPPPDPGWLCSYCPYFKRCVMDGWSPEGNTSIIKGELHNGKTGGERDG